MSALTSKGPVISLITSAILSSLLLACTPSGGGSSQGAGQSPLTIQRIESACETSLRSQMLSKNLFFQDETEFASFINQARQSVAGLSEVKFVVGETSSQVTKLETLHEKVSGDQMAVLKYRLEKNDETSKNPWQLTISFDQIWENHSSKRLEQFFAINSNCEMKWVKSSLRDEKRISKSSYEVDYVDRYVDGSRDVKQKTFQNPEGLPISELLFFGDNVAAHPMSFGIYDADIGFARAQSNMRADKTVNKFGLSMSMQIKEVRLLQGQVEVASVETRFSGEQAISSYKLGANEYWFIPKAIWEQQVLGGGNFENSLIQVSLPKDYLSSNASYKVTGNIPDYEHFSAYQSVLQIGTDESGESKYVFEESALRTYRDQANPEDLESNDIIDLQDSEVQKLARQFLRQAPNDRVMQIKLLLTHLKKNYPYDYSMLTNNIVRSMSVREALERKTGVCQHFAIIFTAVARAMGIPSRVIVGFSLSDTGVGGHAWVEAEVRPGTWQVIEPQKENGLLETYTRFYIPIVRARFLEAKSDQASYAKWAAAFYSLKMKIEPAQ